MRLPWTKDKPRSEPRLEVVAPFGGDLEDFTVLRYHAIRALCGVLMDRHTACRSPHPFCGPSHQQDGDAPRSLIAEVIPQSTTPTDDADRIADLIGIYLCPASVKSSGKGNEEPVEYIARMTPDLPMPNRKLAVLPPTGGVYQVTYGPILNPVEGDYSTGSLDPDNVRPLTSNPEPKHCRWRYWESELGKGDWLVPRFHCLQTFGQWWVVEVDRSRGAAQQVAGLIVADNPEHNSGIHVQKDAVYLRPAGDESEFSKVLRENLPELL